MPGKTSLFIPLIFSILYLQCTPKIYDTPEFNVVYTTINVSFMLSASGGTPALFITNGEQPDFSPDGSTVAFTRDNNIYTVSSGGSYASLYVTPHNVYIADRFQTPLYADNTKIISMVSVAYGNRVVIGADLKFN